MEIASKIEAILFWKAEPIKKAKLAKMLETSLESVEQGILTLQENLAGRGVTLIEHEDEITLATSKENAGLIEGLIKEEITRDIGKAGLETLSIILYMGPISRKEIDYIRGVNSSFIIRHLMIRGFVEKRDNPNDGRAYLYAPTAELLAHLGIGHIRNLPDYFGVTNKLKEFMNKEDTEIKEDEKEDLEKDFSVNEEEANE